MKTSINIQDYVSIGITTKNRWDDLSKTLKKIEFLGYQDIPIFIFDDGSEEQSTIDFDNFNLNINFKRFESSKGLIVRRNELAETISTKYYLSLDDDSYPVTDKLLEALMFAESQDDLFCLSFPIFNPTANIWQSKSQQLIPYPVRFYIGCGHLLNREIFLNLGGYHDTLIHQGEEMDVAIRAYQKGFRCYHYPDFVVHHTVSMTGRNWFRMDYYGSRNNILWNDWYLPEEILWQKQLKNVISRLILSLKVRRRGLIQGILAGFRSLDLHKKNRQRLKLAMYQEWNALPEK